MPLSPGRDLTKSKCTAAPKCFRSDRIRSPCHRGRPNSRDQAFATNVFNAIKGTNFNTLAAQLPKPPFVISMLDHRKLKTARIDSIAFTEVVTRLHDGFNVIIGAIAAEGVSAKDLSLSSITVQENTRATLAYRSFPANFYLLLKTPKGLYKVRIEDCMIVGGKYLPEQLKWYGWS